MGLLFRFQEKKRSYLPGSRILQSISQKIFQLLQLIDIWFVSIALRRPAGPAGLKQLWLFIQKWERKVGRNPEFWVYQAAISLSINCKSEDASSLFCTRNTTVSYIYQKSNIIYLFSYFAYWNRTFCIVPTEDFVWCCQLASVTVCKDWFFLRTWSKSEQP